MSITFDPPPGDESTAALQARFQHAIEQLENDFGRGLAHVVEHTRDEETRSGIERLLTFIEGAAEFAKMIAEKYTVHPNSDLARRLMEPAAAAEPQLEEPRPEPPVPKPDIERRVPRYVERDGWAFPLRPAAEEPELPAAEPPPASEDDGGGLSHILGGSGDSSE